MKYINWLEEWLENYVKLTSKSRTITRYTEIINQHLAPSLGEYELQEISVLVLQKYITELLNFGNKRNGKGLATNSVNSIITVIQSSLRVACNLGLVNECVADKIKRPKTAEKKVEGFTMQEQKKIEKAVLESKKQQLLNYNYWRR